MSQNDEISIKDIALIGKSAINYLRSKWYVIAVVSILAGALGFFYAFSTKPSYTAVSNFVLDEGNRSGALSQYAGLASLAGIDIGGSGGGIFQGDNILELYKSRLMLKKTLLSAVNINGKRELLINRYIEFNNLREKWLKDEKIGSISFLEGQNNLNRKQDSIITDIIFTFNKKYLTVAKPDKKLSIIQVLFNSPDELFAKEFNSKLVETVNDFYTQTRIKKSLQNVKILQKQADSVRHVLNGAISGVAAALDAAPNANPALLTLRVPSQRRQVDVQASTAIYSEVVKNLELGKISLRQEAPLIQIIDQPVLPLAVKKIGKKTAIIVGILLGAFFTSVFLLLKKFIQSALK
ncbi:lipopolysaccharide biosynthesis protein [Mucilaginibacter pallidiroseus]|uniref:Lipopolysaccharide biosynthesis protein n=1 Tax=Mucilaginibacter pallidiroseus TaxID=2599295 RepID=A0A563UIH3_9SPHI|nr:lipopolysaccharide biosynthesis protein [Mucilaginibacter pallidiroseus]TWR31167.1 lipopolysaccharide biosynthesis protein [Mucilaginibacter pallidiroseus]